MDEKKNVLLVDDDIDYLFQMKMQLQRPDGSLMRKGYWPEFPAGLLHGLPLRLLQGLEMAKKWWLYFLTVETDT